MKKILKGSGRLIGTVFSDLDNNFTDVLKALVKMGNPALNLKGYAETSTAEPGTPAENDCYLVIEAGTIWTLTVVEYNIISYDGAGWQVETHKLTELNAMFQALFFEAGNISYDNSTSGMTATDVQAAIDEIWTAINP